MGAWLTTYFKDAGFREGQASGLLSTFWVSLLAGRLITAIPLGAGILAEDYPPWIIQSVALVMTVTLLIMSAARSRPLAALFAVIIGLAAGPVFPTSIGFILKQYPGQSAVVFGAVFAILLIGGALIPGGVGHVSKASSIRKGLLLVAGSAAMLAVMSVVLGVIPLPKG